MAGMNVGDVETRVSFRYDGSDADKFERKESELRRKASKPITQDVRTDTDRATAGMGRYEKSVRSVDDQHGKLARGSGRLRTSMGSLFFGGAGVAAGAVAVGGLAMEVKGATQAFQESEAIGHQTTAVIKSTGGAANVTAKEVGDLATALSKKTGVDDEVIQSGENMLLTFTNIRNETGRGNDVFTQATKTVTDMSVALGQDTKNSAIQLGKALNDPVKGITALQRVGVTFTKQQKEQITTLVAHGKRVQAQKLILHELNREFGGSAAAQNNWSKQLSVTWGNLQETIGKKLAPALATAGKWLNNFLNGLMDGKSSGGQFLGTVRSVASGIRSVLGAAFHFIERVIDDNRKTIQSLGRTFGKLWGDAKRYLGGVAAAFRSTFGSGSGTGRDIRQIISALLKVASVVLSVEQAIAHRALPGIITAFRGLAEVVRGVVKIISGILTGDFGKVWSGVKQLVGGAVKVVGGMIRAMTAPFREVISAISGVVSSGLGKVVGFFKSLPGRAIGAIASMPGRFASLGSKIGSSLVNAVVSAVQALPGKMLSIGEQAAKSLVSGIKHAPGKLLSKVGLKRGGKPGNVGPSHGGARLYVAGEGSRDEWVISQEGDRSSNVAWAREALETLTGRSVGFFKGGGKPKAKKKHVLKPTLAEGTNNGIKRSVKRGEGGIANFERDIQRMERRYDQLDREYGMSEEVLIIENEDGSTTVDESAVQKRLTELGSLGAYRQRISDKYGDYKTQVGKLVTTYTNAVARLNKAIKAAGKSKARGKERAKYYAERDGYRTRVNELKDVAKDLDLDIEDQRLDLADLTTEAQAVGGSTGTPAPSSPGDTPDTGGGDAGTAGGDASGGGGDTSGGGDTGGGDTGGGGETVAPPPSAADIAAAALAEFASFNASRASLFSSFGGNSMSREGLAAMLLGTGPSTSQAAGLRAFGAVPTAGGSTINITNNFGGGPAEPGTWASQQRFAVESAMGT